MLTVADLPDAGRRGVERVHLARDPVEDDGLTIQGASDQIPARFQHLPCSGPRRWPQDAYSSAMLFANGVLAYRVIEHCAASNTEGGILRAEQSQLG